MRTKLMSSAVVLAGVLAFASAGYAQSYGGGHDRNDKGGDKVIDDSFNDHSHTTDSYNDTYNTNVDLGSSFSNNRKYDTDNTNSFNDNRTYDNDTDVDHSFNTEHSNNTNNSFNTDNSTHDWNVRVSLNYQELSANVSDVGFDQREDHDGRQDADMRSGDITQRGGAFAGFAGIQTVSNNSGLASIGQAATAVSANANVTFGSGGQ